MSSEKTGFLSAATRRAKSVGNFYVWSFTGDFSEAKAAIKRMREGLKRIFFGAYRTETFEEAIARLQVTQEFLQVYFRHLQAMAYIYGLIALVAAALLALAPWSPHPIPHALTATSALILTVVQWIVTRYRMAEIRRHTFFRFGDWLFRRSHG